MYALKSKKLKCTKQTFIKLKGRIDNSTTKKSIWMSTVFTGKLIPFCQKCRE